MAGKEVGGAFVVLLCFVPPFGYYWCQYQLQMKMHRAVVLVMCAPVCLYVNLP